MLCLSAISLALDRLPSLKQKALPQFCAWPSFLFHGVGNFLGSSICALVKRWIFITSMYQTTLPKK